MVLDKLRQGHVIYGVNTGFGGNADARSADMLGLQQTLFSMQMCGVLSMGSGVVRPGDESPRMLDDLNNDTGSDNSSLLSVGTSHGTSDDTSDTDSDEVESPNGTEISRHSDMLHEDGKTKTNASLNETSGDTKLVNRRHTLAGGEFPFFEAGTSPVFEVESWTTEVIATDGEQKAAGETVLYAPEPVKEVVTHKQRTPRVILPLDNPMTATCMPESWARAAMLVWLNSLAGGASGIRVTLADTLVELLNKDVVPCMPLCGSISASGDLSPLSYVGAVM